MSLTGVKQTGDNSMLGDTVGSNIAQVLKVAYGAEGVATLVEAAGTGLPVAIGSDGVVTIGKSGAVNQKLQRFLDTNGDGTGTKNAAVDYSSGEEIFFIKPAASTIFRITRLLISIHCGSGSTWGEFGNLAALGTGIEIRHQNDSGTVLDCTDQVLITTNAGIGFHCYDTQLMNAGTGDDFVAGRWSFGGDDKSGAPIRLDGDDADNERLEVVLNDNFSTFTAMYFKINGYVE